MTSRASLLARLLAAGALTLSTGCHGESGVDSTGEQEANKAGSSSVDDTSSHGGSGQSSDELPVCFAESCAESACYKRGDEATCLPIESPGLPARVGCTFHPNQDVHSFDGSENQCCYAIFCGGGRPLRIAGLPSLADRQVRADWG